MSSNPGYGLSPAEGGISMTRNLVYDLGKQTACSSEAGGQVVEGEDGEYVNEGMDSVKS